MSTCINSYFSVFLLQTIHNKILQEYRGIKNVTFFKLHHIRPKIASCDYYYVLFLFHNSSVFLIFPFSPTPTTTRTRSAVNIYTTNWPTSKSSYRNTTNNNSVWTILFPTVSETREHGHYNKHRDLGCSHC